MSDPADNNLQKRVAKLEERIKELEHQLATL